MQSRSIFIIALVVLLVIPFYGYGDQWQDLIEKKDKGVVNWTKGVVQATGIGAPPEKLYGKPSARPMAENAMPVLPLVASMINAPGSIVPRSYAHRRIWSAIRSFTLPVMLRFSLLANSVR